MLSEFPLIKNLSFSEIKPAPFSSCAIKLKVFLNGGLLANLELLLNILFKFGLLLNSYSTLFNISKCFLWSLKTLLIKSVDGHVPNEEGDVKLPQVVKTVNHIRPDENGNVDTPDCYTKEESDNRYQPKDNYVKTVNNVSPDQNGNVNVGVPSLDGYLRASDLKFRVVEDPTDEHRYLEVSMDGGTNYTRVLDATCVCEHGDTPTPPQPTPAIITVSIVTAIDAIILDVIFLNHGNVLMFLSK